MSKLILNAKNYRKKALEQLYNDNKSKVLYVTESILQNKTEAEKITSIVFKNIWADFSESNIYTEDDFTYYAIKKAAALCKKQLIKNAPQAFKVPQNKNFIINVGTVTVAKDDICKTVLQNLNELQRFIFVLYTAGKYSINRLAEATKMDLRTIQMALNSLKTNINNILSKTESEIKSYDELSEIFITREADVEFPKEIDETTVIEINKLSAPIEKSLKIKKTIISIISFILCAAIILGAVFIVSSVRKNSSKNSTSSSSATSGTIDYTSTMNKVTYYADINIKDYGTITLALDGGSAPITVENFVSLAKDGYYNGLTFHRIIKDFVMQGGDIGGDGISNDGEKSIKGEFTANGVNNYLTHCRGAVSLARSSDYDSGSTQFFIVHQDASTSLDGEYAVFGYVTEGMDIVDKICEEANPTDNNGTISADEQPVISSITIKEA